MAQMVQVIGILIAPFTWMGLVPVFVILGFALMGYRQGSGAPATDLDRCLLGSTSLGTTPWRPGQASSAPVIQVDPRRPPLRTRHFRATYLQEVDPSLR
jgi:hypothetical protein